MGWWRVMPGRGHPQQEGVRCNACSARLQPAQARMLGGIATYAGMQMGRQQLLQSPSLCPAALHIHTHKSSYRPNLKAPCAE